MDALSETDSDLEYQAKRNTALSSKAKLDSLTKQRDAARKNIQKSFDTKISTIKKRVGKATDAFHGKHYGAYTQGIERLQKAIQASTELEEAVVKRIAQLEDQATATTSHLRAIFEDRKVAGEEATKMVEELLPKSGQGH